MNNSQKFRSARETMFVLYESDPSLKYREGKIYMLTTPDNPRLCCIGHTAQSLHDRIAHHCNDFDHKCQIQSKEILKYRHFTIDLIEYFPCSTKEEIEGHEYEIMRDYQSKYDVVSLLEDEIKPGSIHPLDIPRGDRYPLKKRTNILKEWYTDAMKYREGIIYAIVSVYTDDIYLGSTVHSLRSRLYRHCWSYDKYQETGNGKYSCSVNEILKYPDFEIILLKRYPCANKKELLEEEARWIRMFDNVVNRNIPGRTAQVRYKENRDAILTENRRKYNENPEYYRQQKREWCAKNRELVNAYKREYRLREPERHKTWWQNYIDKHGMEYIRQKAREYYAENRDHILSLAAARREKRREITRKYNRDQYAKNRDHILEKRKEQYDPAKRKERNLIVRVCECGIEIKGDNLAHHRDTVRHRNIITAMTKQAQGEEVSERELLGERYWHCELCNETVLETFRERHERSTEHDERIKLMEAHEMQLSTNKIKLPPNAPAQFRGMKVPKYWYCGDLSNSTDVFILLMCMSDEQLVLMTDKLEVPLSMIRKKNSMIVKRDRALGTVLHLFGPFSLDTKPSKDRFYVNDSVKQWCSVCCDVYSDVRTTGGGRQSTHESSEKHQEALLVSLSERTNTPCEIECECGECVLRGKTYRTHLTKDSHKDRIRKMTSKAITISDEAMNLRLDRLAGRVVPPVTGDRTQKVVCVCGDVCAQSSIRSKHMQSQGHCDNKEALKQYCNDRGIDMEIGLHVYMENAAEQRVREHIYNLTVLDETTLADDQILCTCGHVGKKSSLRSHMKTQHCRYVKELPDEFKE